MQDTARQVASRLGEEVNEIGTSRVILGIDRHGRWRWGFNDLGLG